MLKSSHIRKEYSKMKKLLAALVVVALSAGTAMARGPMSGPDGCFGPGMTGPKAEAHKKHLAETLPLRQEMMNKHFDLQKECIKDKPDANVIGKLQGEIGALRTKLMELRQKAGFPAGQKAGKGYKSHRGHKAHRMHGGMGGGMMEDCPYLAAPPVPPAK